MTCSAADAVHFGRLGPRGSSRPRRQSVWWLLLSQPHVLREFIWGSRCGQGHQLGTALSVARTTLPLDLASGRQGGWLAPGLLLGGCTAGGGGSGTRQALSHSPGQDRSCRGGAGADAGRGRGLGGGVWEALPRLLRRTQVLVGLQPGPALGPGAPGPVGAAPACSEPTAQLMEQERRGWGEL